MSELWDALVGEAAGESPLWAESALAPDAQRREPIFSMLCERRFALGVETIYEGYLLHYGRPRLFAPADADTALLLGDYLYAHGLVRIAATGSVEAVNDLAELISLCAQARAEGTEGDWAVWAATAASRGAGTLDAARARLRQFRDPCALEHVARAVVGDDAVERACVAHDLHVGRRVG
ncbi:MAG: hypothetical protein ABI927_09305 [Gaiellaceae bacterium]